MDYVENVIIGAGPAGLQMAYFFERDMRQSRAYVVLEAGRRAGTFFEKYPRMRKLISVNKVSCGGQHRQHNAENVLRYDWNSLLTHPWDQGKIMFRDFDQGFYPSADSLVEYLNAFEREFHLNVRYGCRVTKIVNSGTSETPENRGFVVTYAKDGKEVSIECQRCFVASGLKLNTIPGVLPSTATINKHGTTVFSYENVPLDDLELFRNKSVLIVGGGNSGFEIANALNEVVDTMRIVSSEKFAWNNHYPGYVRSVNMRLLDSYYLKLKLNLDWDSSPYFRYSEKLQCCINDLVGDGETDRNFLGDCEYDFIVATMGFSPSFKTRSGSGFVCVDDLDFDDQTGFPVLTPFFESTSCKNLFFLGALSQNADYKKGTSAFIHGFRYNCRLTHQYITDAFHAIRRDSLEGLCDEIMLSINQSSTLLHRFDFFGDYVFLDLDATGSGTVVKGLPLALHTREHLDKVTQGLATPGLATTAWRYLLKVRLGYDPRNAFFPCFRQPQTGNLLRKDESVLIHPIVSVHAMRGDELVDLHTYHLPEEAFNKYTHVDYYYHFLLKVMYFIVHSSDNAVTTRALECIDDVTRLEAWVTLKNAHADHTLEFLDSPA